MNECAVCSMPLPAGARSYCGPTCQRAAAASRKRERERAAWEVTAHSALGYLPNGDLAEIRSRLKKLDSLRNSVVNPAATAAALRSISDQAQMMAEDFDGTFAAELDRITGETP